MAADESGTVQQREVPRDSMFLQARLIRANGTVGIARIRNLSPCGMMADNADQWYPHEPICIEMRGIDRICGRVAWSKDGRVGVSFERRIDPAATRQGPRDSAPPILPTSEISREVRRPGFR